jgi:hypothetical protein
MVAVVFRVTGGIRYVKRVATFDAQLCEEFQAYERLLGDEGRRQEYRWGCNEISRPEEFGGESGALRVHQVAAMEGSTSR